jgi:hypothetical protein
MDGDRFDSLTRALSDVADRLTRTEGMGEAAAQVARLPREPALWFATGGRGSVAMRPARSVRKMPPRRPRGGPEERGGPAMVRIAKFGFAAAFVAALVALVGLAAPAAHPGAAAQEATPAGEG